MLRPNNLCVVYEVFPANMADTGSVKELNLDNPNYDQITVYMLVEAERFWAATLLQLVGTQELEKVWLHSWSEVSLYYAGFFAANALMRLAGRSVTFSRRDGQTRKIKRLLANRREYEISKTDRGDHNVQWNWYYDLIQPQPSDDKILKAIFDSQLKYKHLERWMREIVNYDLEYGFDERHYSEDALRDRASMMVTDFPFRQTEDALGSDTYSEIATIIYCWKHTKSLFESIARETAFCDYWNLQVAKLRDFVNSAPFLPVLKEWALNELR